MKTHTPTYRVKGTKNDNVEIIDNEYNTVAKMTWYPDGLNVKTAREFVTAVNSHEELLSIIKRELEMEGSVSESEMKRAIAKAEGRI